MQPQSLPQLMEAVRAVRQQRTIERGRPQRHGREDLVVHQLLGSFRVSDRDADRWVFLKEAISPEQFIAPKIPVYPEQFNPESSVSEYYTALVDRADAVRVALHELAHDSMMRKPINATPLQNALEKYVAHLKLMRVLETDCVVFRPEIYEQALMLEKQVAPLVDEIQSRTCRRWPAR